MKVRTLQAECVVDKPLDDTFAFFADAHNLDRITPPFLHFEILTPAPIDMQVGILIDYRLRLHGIPIRWRTKISVWQPPHRFVDEQIRGPYKRWIHTHDFEEHGVQTIIRDRVDYASPGWIFEPLLHYLFVGRDLDAIFRYRQERTLELLGSKQPADH